MPNVHIPNPQYQTNMAAFLRQQKEARKELQDKLDRCYQRISERNQQEITRMERAVGEVEGFCGVISRF